MVILFQETVREAIGITNYTLQQKRTLVIVVVQIRLSSLKLSS